MELHIYYMPINYVSTWLRADSTYTITASDCASIPCNQNLQLVPQDLLLVLLAHRNLFASSCHGGLLITICADNIPILSPDCLASFHHITRFHMTVLRFRPYGVGFRQ